MPRQPKWYATEGILGVKFNSAKSVSESIRALVARYPNNVPIREDDFLFLIDFFKHHAEWEEKVGSGIKSIVVRTNVLPAGTSRGFWFIRTDGSEVDVSWTAVLNPPSEEALLRKAARMAICDQIEEVRQRDYGQPCTICGNPLLTQLHVDHAAPHTFEWIFTLWLSQVEKPRLMDAGLYSDFSDDRMKKNWQDFHWSHSSLRLVHSDENLGILKKWQQ